MYAATAPLHMPPVAASWRWTPALPLRPSQDASANQGQVACGNTILYEGPAGRSFDKG